MGQSGKQMGKIKLVKRSQLKSVIASLNSRALSRQVHKERSNKEVRSSPHHDDLSLDFNVSPSSSLDRRESSQNLETNTSTLARLTHQEDNGRANSNNTEGQPNVSHGSSTEIVTSSQGEIKLFNAPQSITKKGKPRSENTRGPNKPKKPKRPVLIEVNGRVQPISDEARQMSSLIGCHACHPRKLPIDVEWHDMPDERIDHIWNIFKESYTFREGSKEPYP